jgi:hypothetical protein
MKKKILLGNEERGNSLILSLSVHVSKIVSRSRIPIHQEISLPKRRGNSLTLFDVGRCTAFLLSEHIFLCVIESNLPHFLSIRSSSLPCVRLNALSVSSKLSFFERIRFSHQSQSSSKFSLSGTRTSSQFFVSGIWTDASPSGLTFRRSAAKFV